MSSSSFGRSLIRDRNRRHNARRAAAPEQALPMVVPPPAVAPDTKGSDRRATALPPAPPPSAAAAAARNPRSVTQTSALEELVETAALAEAAFAVERAQTVLLTRTAHAQPPRAPHTSAVAERAASSVLRIPRRPPWTAQTSPAALDRAEREAFLAWRRALAQAEERENLLLTPYEKNVEMWRQLWRVVERSDAVVQLVDARDPTFFRCADLEAYCAEVAERQQRAGGRPTMVLLNKGDLLTRAQRAAWARYFAAKGVAVAFFSALRETLRNEAEKAKALKQQQQQQMHDEDDDDDDEEEEAMDTDSDEDVVEEEEEEEEEEEPGAKCLSSDELVERFEQLVAGLRTPEKEEEKRPIVIGMCGFPNVGKSSTINALCGRKCVAVTSTPGKTKHFQTINLTPRVTLCDCPGLVFPTFLSSKAEMICNGVLSIDQASDYQSPVAVICSRIPHAILCRRYGVEFTSEEAAAAAIASAEPLPPDMATEPTEAARFLCAIARARGFKTQSHGAPDQSRAARIVVKDYVNGRLFYAMPPPGMSPAEFEAWTGAEGADAAALTDEAAAESQQPRPSSSAAAAAPKPATQRKPRRSKGKFKMAYGATGEEYTGTVHVSGRNGTDDFVRAHWKHSPVPVAQLRAATKKQHR